MTVTKHGTIFCTVALVVALSGLLAPVWVQAEQDWSNYDWSQEEIVLGTPGETTDQAIQTAREAVANSQMQITMSTVGFDISAGSTAEQYLQKAAQVGGGSYFRAEAGGQLAEIMGAAATGQSSGIIAGGSNTVTLLTPRDGEVVGPSVVVSGRAQPGVLVVIYTAPGRPDTGEELKNVPGARRQTEPDGSFSVRIALPRVSFGETDTPVGYRVRAYVARQDGQKGPETEVSVVGQRT